MDSVPHHLSVLGTRPQRRYFPTEKGVTAAGAATKGREHMLRTYPVSKQWFRLLAERLDAVAVLHRVAAMVANADPHDDPVRRGPLPQRPLRHAHHPVRGAHHRPDPPGTSPAHVQAPLPPQEHRAAGQRRHALRHPGADPRRPGTPAGPSAPWATRRSIAGPS